jgi:hypothetical protein
VTWRLKTGTVEPEQTAAAKQWIGKQHGDLLNLILFFQNEERGLTISMERQGNIKLYGAG